MVNNLYQKQRVSLTNDPQPLTTEFKKVITVSLTEQIDQSEESTYVTVTEAPGTSLRLDTPEGRLLWIFVGGLGVLAVLFVVLAFVTGSYNLLWLSLGLALSSVVTLIGSYLFQQSIATQVDERDKAFKEIMHNAEQARLALRSGLEGMNDALLIADIEGKLIFHNKPAEDLLHWCRAENHLFKTIDEWLAPLRQTVTTKDTFKMLMVNAREKSGMGQVPSFEFGIERPLTETTTLIEPPTRPTPFLVGMGEVGRDPTGDPANRPVRDLRLTLFPIYDASGRQIGTGYLLRDVTRDRELDRLKDQFVSMVSHEIRNPLSTILSMTELLQMDDLSLPERQKWARQINTETLRLRSMLNDMLDLSRLEEGRLELMVSTLDARNVVREVLENFQLEQNHELILDVQTEFPKVVADHDKLVQILINLVGNAIKYSPKGGEVRITLRTTIGGEGEDERQFTEIGISDQGMGIPASEKEKIFGRFFRSTTSRKSGISGTGLGLSITQRLVKLQGGNIWFTSEEGQGTTFYLTLPAPRTNLEVLG
jgi:signal transduction histidine kinase